MIKQVKRGDSKRVWQIRNHPKVRQNSNNSEEISFGKHNKWFENKYFNNNDNFCFVSVTDNKVIGYCRFDLDKEKDCYVISIAVDADYHGKGRGHLLLSRFLQKFTKNKNILAEIQKENIPSIKLFQKNNFIIYKEDDKNYYLKFAYGP